MDRPSLAQPPPVAGTPHSYVWPARIVLMLALAFALVLVYRSAPDPDVRMLHDEWVVRAQGSEGVVALDDQLPAVWSTANGGPEQIFATTQVVADGRPMALWLEVPRYEVEVTWDGLPVDVPRSPVVSARPILVVLPAAPAGSRHELGLDVTGRFGETGVVGRIALGPVPSVHDLASSTRIGGVASALALVLLATLPLLVAARGAWRPAYLAYGATIVCAGVLIWSYSAHPALAGMPAGWQLALQRAFMVWTASCIGAYLLTFIEGHVPTLATQLVVVGSAGGALLGLAPDDMAWWARMLSHGFAVVVIGLATVTVLRAAHRNVPGYRLLLVAQALGCLALILELVFNYGVRPLPVGNYLTILSMLVLQGGALMLRDADISERHERLLERFPDPLLTVDSTGHVVDANPAARVAVGVAPSAASPRPLVFAWVDPEHHPRVRGHLRRGLHRTDHIELRSAEGRWYESAATPVTDDLVLLDLRDVTARRDMDKGLLQAARAETAGLLLGGLAHDFNNMLGTLLAHVGILKLRTTDTEVSQRLGRMERSIERAASLTKRLLTVARGTTTTLSTCDLRGACLGAAELVEPTLPPDVRLLVDVPADLPPVHGDPDDLEQVLVNLLVNARDALGTRGTVRLVARPFQLPDGHRGVAAMVEDDGPGVPMELREELFEPFVTTKGHGTGLGLSVARQILADHLGRLWHEPAPGGGARFLLAVRHADTVSEAPAPLPAQRQVLLVDDEEVLLEAWASALHDAGYEVQATPDPVEAVERIRSSPPDLLVTDLAMQPISGLEVARSMQSRAPEAPVLVVSAFVAPDVQQQLSSRGWEFLTKPVRTARLVAAVGHLRRKAERRDAGEDDITSVMHVFPALEELSARTIGFPDPDPTDVRHP